VTARAPDVSPVDPAKVEQAVRLGDQLAHAWGSWGPNMTRDAGRVAFISDRRGRPELWVAEVVVSGRQPAPTPLPLSPDPVLAVRWSADGSWLACAV
jgi:Tol biopolymer transport system component